MEQLLTLALVVCLALWLMARFRRRTRADLERRIAESHAAMRVEPRPRPPVKLSNEALTRLNIQRRHTGRPPLSPAGYYRAMRTARDDMHLSSQNDWLLYFLLWDAAQKPGAPVHYTQGHVSIPNSLEIQPGGGTFGGGGASGMWTEPERPTPDGFALGLGVSIAGTVAAQEAEERLRFEPPKGREGTFEVPPGYVAERDDEGRATGVVTPVPEVAPAPEPERYTPPAASYEPPAPVTDPLPEASRSYESTTPQTSNDTPSSDSSPSYSGGGDSGSSYSGGGGDSGGESSGGGD